jgi:hypothetical protein
MFTFTMANITIYLKHPKQFYLQINYEGLRV